MSVQNTITVGNNNGASSTFNPADSDDKVAFTVTLRDGCTTATLNSPTLSTSSLTVDDGGSAQLTFTDASDSFGTYLSQIDFCGTRNYEV